MTKKIDEKQDGASEACKAFFGKKGEEEVRNLLVGAVRDAREAQNISPKQLDEACFLVEDNWATCEQFEQDSSKMTQEIFCRAACLLDLKINEVLGIDFSEENNGNLKKAISIMRKNKGRLAAAQGGDGTQPIPDTEVAPVYATFKILSEV